MEHERESARKQVARVVRLHSTGDRLATSALLPLVYDKLRGLAHRYMRGENASHTLQPTALVHEAFVRLTDGTDVDWRGKTHFFAVAARQMRRVLIDHARAGQAEKRGGKRYKVELTDGLALSQDRTLELLSLDESLNRLAKRNERHSRVVELRVFGGLQFDEMALVLEVSERTIRQDWKVARAWLSRELRRARHGV